MRDLWSGAYREPPCWAETAERLIALAELQAGVSVLDVGTGYGGTLFRALGRVGATGRVVSIDVDDDCIEWTRSEIAKRGITNAEVLRMDARAMDFGDASFDGVVAGLVGLDEDYDFDAGKPIDGAPMIREIFRVLKPGGRLSISDWLWQDDNEWMGELVRRVLLGCRKRGYSRGTTKGQIDVLAGVGFEDVRVITMEGRYTFDDPAEWMAVLKRQWAEELDEIRALPSMLRAFEKDALALLAKHVDEDGKIAYARPTAFVTARRPSPH
ncbi:MAG: class I SAM-dependent methyltransferase [Candidatus Bipolaricaulota bacterium]|nr:class I SAM-dependent methyltransferase [Candidatus Bipolaricaulota bacterium]